MRGLKHILVCVITNPYRVAPHAGAWIETAFPPDLWVRHGSHPTRVRGLKLLDRIRKPYFADVAPHAGAWIETGVNMGLTGSMNKSHPTRVRGLKQGKNW